MLKKLLALILVLIFIPMSAMAGWVTLSMQKDKLQDTSTEAAARFEALQQLMESLQLEMQITDLEIQLATMKEDAAALAAAESEKAALLQEIAELSALIMMSMESMQTTLQQQAATLRAEIDALEIALAENEAQQQELQARYEEYLLSSALRASAKGFISEVTVYVMLDDNNAISALYVDASKETPFMGSRCGEDEAFLSQFIGKTGPLTLGVDVDALSSATFTSNAVVTAINSLFATSAAPAEVMTGTARGFQSEVTVTMTVEEGVIVDFAVDASGETLGFGTRCGEDAAFLTQFIGKKATPDLGEGIDALSGATITSNAVIEAANAAIGVSQAVVDIPSEYTASAKGLLSDVQVTVTVDESGYITDIAVDASGETQAIAHPCTEIDFLSQFIGRSGPFTDVDVVTGATFTSNAVINAVNSLYEEGVIK